MIDPFYSKNVVDVPVSDIETYQVSTPRQLDHPGTAMTEGAELPVHRSRMLSCLPISARGTFSFNPYSTPAHSIVHVPVSPHVRMRS
jgi:hypothetical protein